MLRHGRDAQSHLVPDLHTRDVALLDAELQLERVGAADDGDEITRVGMRADALVRTRRENHPANGSAHDARPDLLVEQIGIAAQHVDAKSLEAFLGGVTPGCRNSRGALRGGHGGERRLAFGAALVVAEMGDRGAAVDEHPLAHEDAVDQSGQCRTYVGANERPEHRVHTGDTHRPANERQSRESDRRDAEVDATALRGEVEPGSLLRADRADRAREGHLPVESRVSHRDSALVREDRGEIALARCGEIRARRFEQEDSDDPFLVLEREIEAAHRAVALEVLAEDLHEGALGVGAGVGALGEEERLPDAGRPGGTHGEVLKRGILGVDAVGAGNGADVADPVLVERDGTAVEVERLAGEVDDGAQHAIEIERRGDLAAHLGDERQLARRLGGSTLARREAVGARHRDAGGGGEAAQRLTLGRSVAAVSGERAGQAQHRHRALGDDDRRGSDRDIRFLRKRTLDVVGSDGDAGQRLTPVSERAAAVELIAARHPDRAAFDGEDAAGGGEHLAGDGARVIGGEQIERRVVQRVGCGGERGGTERRRRRESIRVHASPSEASSTVSG